MKTFRIADFSGGLNTASAEANLPANMSADMLNVDFTETGAITRRNGYTTVSATLGNGTALKGLYRYYKADGSSFWIGVNATAAYYKAVVTASEHGWTSVDDVDLTYSSTAHEHVPGPDSYDGTVTRIVSGTAVTISGVPYCNRAYTRAYVNTTASFKWNSDAFTNVAPNALFQGDLTATSGNTLTVKPKARNAKSLKLVGAAGKYSHEYYDLSATSTRHVKLRFYDTGDVNAAGEYVGIGLGSSTTAAVGLVINAVSSNYCLGLFTPRTSTYSFDPASNPVGRSVGWHNLDLFQNGAQLTLIVDSTTVRTYTLPSSSTRYLHVSVWGAASVYVDNVQEGPYIDPAYYNTRLELIDDFDNKNGWTESTNSGVAATASSAQYTTEVHPIYIDYVNYAVITTPTRLDATVSATSEHIGFTTADDKMYWGTKYDPLKSWSGTVSATVTATVKAEFIVPFKYRLFAGTGYLLNYTAADDYDGWTAVGGGSINVAEKDSGSYCTGLKVWQDRLFWAGVSSLHYIDVSGDPSAWSRKVVTRAHGCVAPKTFTDCGNSLVFLSSKAVRAYGLVEGINSDDGAATLNISRNIEPTIASIPQSMLTKACGAFYKGRYWLSCSTSSTTTNDTMLVCDLDRKVKVGDQVQPVWTRYSLSGITSFCVARGDDYGLYAGTSTGKIVQLDTTQTDDGTAISLRYVTAPMAPKGYSTVKHWKALHASVEASDAQSVTITPATDDVNGAVATVNVSGTTDLQPSRNSISARGRYIKYTIESDGQGQPMTLHSLEQVYHPTERLR